MAVGKAQKLHGEGCVMGFVYRKATISDSERVAGLFEEMLRTIYHTQDVEGYENGYLDKFFLRAMILSMLRNWRKN